jgi:Glycosyl transferases group 1
METIDNDTFASWREEGCLSIQENFQVFSQFLTQAKDFVKCGHYEAAAVYGEMAAVYATLKHSGLFVSIELEQILLEISQKSIPIDYNSKITTTRLAEPRKILHVATSVQAIGGLSKMLWRWIEQDSSRSHSLVLTRQPRKEVPKILDEAINNSGGKIYWLNETIGSVISWAKRLKEISNSADMVVLHIYNHDVIPIIAFANQAQSPPIIFLDHADHMFWLGAGISDVVVNLRESGMRLAQKRRTIQPERNILLPTILEKTRREFSRSEAKQKLGISEDTVVLLSIARSLKYKTINGISYADAHVPLLQKHPEAILIVIGSGNREDWSAAIEQTNGRIRSYPEREDTAIFYQAADIYVDSFPFISTTSLLEAGSYGVPLVSRYPYSDASEILGADMPGLTGNLIWVRELSEYTNILSRLVEDELFRLNLGEKTRCKIQNTHTGENWQSYLEKVYQLATILPKATVPLPRVEEIFLSEPDVLMPRVHGWNFDMNNVIQSHLTIMPFEQRLHNWWKLMHNNTFNNCGRFGPLKYLVPEWFLCRIR